MAAHQFAGVGVALVTPFDESGEVDMAGVARVVDHVVTGGVSYLVPLGTTGETSTLTQAERQQVIEAVLQANAGRVPVLLGCGGNDTRAVAADMQAYTAQYGSQLAGFLSVSPAYNKPTQEGIYQHYRALCQTTDLPIMLYNVPGRTSSNMLPATVLRLAHDFPQIVAIKEASGSLEQGMEILRDAPQGFAVISGDDALALPSVACGYAGVISVIGNSYPGHYSQLVQAALRNDYATAQQLQLALLRTMQLNFRENNPAGVKAALHAQGVCGPWVRLPLVPASPELLAAQAAALEVLRSLVV
jgi:4-hydroxy-tetrahydrodipicolinate synthase